MAAAEVSGTDEVAVSRLQPLRGTQPLTPTLHALPCAISGRRQQLEDRRLWWQEQRRGPRQQRQLQQLWGRQAALRGQGRRQQRRQGRGLWPRQGWAWWQGCCWPGWACKGRFRAVWPLARARPRVWPPRRRQQQQQRLQPAAGRQQRVPAGPEARQLGRRSRPEQRRPVRALQPWACISRGRRPSPSTGNGSHPSCCSTSSPCRQRQRRQQQPAGIPGPSWRASCCQHRQVRMGCQGRSQLAPGPKGRAAPQDTTACHATATRAGHEAGTGTACLPVPGHCQARGSPACRACQCHAQVACGRRYSCYSCYSRCSCVRARAVLHQGGCSSHKG